MIHETDHLIGLNDEGSRIFADTLLNRMFNQGEGDIHVYILRVSGDQKTIQQIAAIQNLKTTRLSEMQHQDAA